MEPEKPENDDLDPSQAIQTVEPREQLRQLRCLRRRFDCYRVERTSSRAGVTPAEVQRLFTAHCYSSYRFVQFSGHKKP